MVSLRNKAQASVLSVFSSVGITKSVCATLLLFERPSWFIIPTALQIFSEVKLSSRESCYDIYTNTGKESDDPDSLRLK